MICFLANAILNQPKLIDQLSQKSASQFGGAAASRKDNESSVSMKLRGSQLSKRELFST